MKTLVDNPIQTLWITSFLKRPDSQTSRNELFPKHTLTRENRPFSNVPKLKRPKPGTLKSSHLLITPPLTRENRPFSNVPGRLRNRLTSYLGERSPRRGDSPKLPAPKKRVLITPPIPTHISA